jgi:hypothetical protein
MDFTGKAKAAFDRLFHISHWWVSRQSPTKLRNHEVETKPGDMLDKMSAEDREAIKHLKSDDLAEEKVPLLDVLLAADSGFYSWQGYTKMLKEAKKMFDKKIVKHDPRAVRKKY